MAEVLTSPASKRNAEMTTHVVEQQQAIMRVLLVGGNKEKLTWLYEAPGVTTKLASDLMKALLYPAPYRGADNLLLNFQGLEWSAWPLGTNKWGTAIDFLKVNVLFSTAPVRVKSEFFPPFVRFAWVTAALSGSPKPKVVSSRIIAHAALLAVGRPSGNRLRRSAGARWKNVQALFAPEPPDS